MGKVSMGGPVSAGLGEKMCLGSCVPRIAKLGASLLVSGLPADHKPSPMAGCFPGICYRTENPAKFGYRSHAVTRRVLWE